MVMIIYYTGSSHFHPLQEDFLTRWVEQALITRFATQCSLIFHHFAPEGRMKIVSTGTHLLSCGSTEEADKEEINKIAVSTIRIPYQRTILRFRGVQYV